MGNGDCMGTGTACFGPCCLRLYGLSRLSAPLHIRVACRASMHPSVRARACAGLKNLYRCHGRVRMLPGVLVHGGKVLEGATGGGGTVFGKTTDGHWLLGDYNPSTSTLDVPEALSAFQWLVFNGTVTPTAGGEVAPRTAIGVDTKGRLVLLEVDGCEKCATGDQGLTLYGVAQLLLSHGVLNAINLDGGGSSSMVVNGSFINRPTCIDTWIPICERAVTTVVCV